MRKVLFFLSVMTALSQDTIAQNSLWAPAREPETATVRKIIPEHYLVFSLHSHALQGWLQALTSTPHLPETLYLPQPDGYMRAFHIWETPLLAPGLAAKFPGIKTFTGYAADNKLATLKLDYTTKGFHAMVFDGQQTYAIDPYADEDNGYYIVYYKKDYRKPDGKHMICELSSGEVIAEPANEAPRPEIWERLHGETKKVYRMALACTGEYAMAVAGSTPAVPDVLSAMATTMHRVNGIFERELAVSMELIADNDQLVFLDPATDPYTNNNGSVMLGQNQTTVTNIIGAANYDIGHVFSTGGGGIASLGCVCRNNNKARGVTGSSSPVGDFFDVDYVAHEIGHQFGATHTFNANTSSCQGNGSSSSAFEPGGGSTIMAYAGICGAGNNLQSNSDAYFHGKSLYQMTEYITNAQGNSCPVTTPSGNMPPELPPFTASYFIPFLTPFELTAPAAVDSDHDSLLYCWEQWDLGDFRSSWSAPNLQGPIFRSFAPDTSRTRVFPTLYRLVNNMTSYIGEKLPEDERELNFKLTVRDVLQGWGSYNFPEDSITISVVNTITPFKVTEPNTAVSWVGGTHQTITWDVSGTDQAPISCAAVDIYLSVDGGYTYPYLLKEATPNDGSEAVYIPNISASQARIKVKGNGNIFFDLSNEDFSILQDPTNSIQEMAVSWAADVVAFPVPARTALHLESRHVRPLQVNIVQVTGKKVWSGKITDKIEIAVSEWASGIYFVTLSDDTTGETVVKRIAVQ